MSETTDNHDATTTHVKNVDASEEKILAEKVGPLYAGKTQEAAVRYGRKLLRKAAGKRSSYPPHTGLSSEQAKKVAEALGMKVEPKAKAAPKKAAEPKAAPSEGNGREAKPDPKPESSRKKATAKAA